MIARLILFLSLASAAFGAAWTIPAANQGAWLPGTNVGVDGGIFQYRPGGASERLNAAGINVKVSIPSSSYIAAGVDTQTTGTATGGSTTVSLADASSYAVGHGIRFGNDTVMHLVITGGASSSGTATLTINGTAYNVSVTSGDTIAQVATKFFDASFGPAVKSRYNNTGVYYLVPDRGVTASGSFSAGTTGVTASFTVSPSAYAGTQTVTVTVTAGATSSGDITVTLNGTAQTVAVTAGDTIAQVAAKIVAATYSNASVSASGSTAAAFITTDRGALANCSIDGGTTGVTGTRSVSYAAYTRRITAISGDDITVDAAITTGFTGQMLEHDDRPAINAAITAATSGQAIYVPAGTYRIEGSITIPHTKDGVTIRGDGPDQTIFYGANGGASVFAFSEAGGVGGSSVQSITGTKGTSVLAVSSTSGYTEGEIGVIYYDNEEDNTRIQAGAAPTWSQGGYRRSRNYIYRVVNIVPGTSIEVDPALPWDATYANATIERHSLSSQQVESFGFEDFSISFNPANLPLFGIKITNAVNCWAYNVGTSAWARNTSNGSVIRVDSSYKVEIRHCDGYAEEVSSSDGFIQMSASSSCLYVDNITKNFDVAYYNSGYTVNNAYLNNFIITAQATGKEGFNTGHFPHPSLELYEGNIVNFVGADGYHGSQSHNTLFRNIVHGSNEGLTLSSTTVALRRFTRYFVHAGNVFGWDGVNRHKVSLGNPNIGNGNNNGDTASALSGDFWADWKLTGTLTGRASGTVGELTASGGDWGATSGGSAIKVSLYWDGYTKRLIDASISARTGNVFTISGGTFSPSSTVTALPDLDTVFDLVQPNTAGFQELDSDVETTLTETHNYVGSITGTGSVVNSTADTLPNSLAYTSRPAWWPVSLTWPAVDPDSPTFSFGIIPAGYRFVNGYDAGGTPIVATPSFAPSSTTHSTPQTIYAASATSGVTFYYTLDGTTPTSGSALYNDGTGISLTYGTTTVKMIGVKAAHTDSAVRSVTYVITAESGAGSATITTLNVGTLNIP